MKIALVGCGVVGQGLLKIIRDKEDLLRDRFDLEVQLVAVSDKLKGSILHDGGIPIAAFLEHLEAKKPIGDFTLEGAEYGLDAVPTIQRTNADVVVEVAYTDVKTGEPASTHLREAFRAKKHVSTTNKGPGALHFAELSTLARVNDVLYKYEGTVMSGTPVFNLLDYTLAGNDVHSIKGILNGTTNFILTKMEEDGMAYQDALKLAQELGYAEADPTADVEGFDALAKVLILSNVVLGGGLKEADVERVGITGISIEDINAAKAEGMRYKLIGETRWVGDEVVASVKPVKLPLSDPLAGVGGAINALTFETDLMGPVTIQGAGAGQLETGFSVLIDLINIHRETSPNHGA